MSSKTPSTLGVEVLVAAAQTIYGPDIFDSATVAEAAKLREHITPFRIGDRVLIRTATIYEAGIIVYIDADWIVLIDGDCVLEVGETKKVRSKEPFTVAERYRADTDRVQVSRGAIVSIVPAEKKS